MLIPVNEQLALDLGLLASKPEYCSEFCAQALEALGSGARSRSAFKAAAGALGVETDAVVGVVMAIAETFVAAAKANLSANDLVGSLGDVKIPEDAKRTMADTYALHARVLRESVGLGGGAGAGEQLTGAGAAAPVAPAPTGGLALAMGSGTGGSGIGSLNPSSGASATLPEFRSLSWRLEVEIARRHLHDSMRPQVTLQLDTLGLGPRRGSDGGAGAPSPGGGAGGEATPIPLLASLGPHSFTFVADCATLRKCADTLDEAQAELRTAAAKRVQRFIK